MGEIHKKVLDRIPTKREKAVHLAALSSELAISETQVKAIVKILRLQGIPVCSDKKGYWIAENDIERAEFIDLMENQAKSRLRVAREIRKQKIAGSKTTLLEKKDEKSREKKF